MGRGWASTATSTRRATPSPSATLPVRTASGSWRALTSPPELTDRVLPRPCSRCSAPPPPPVQQFAPQQFADYDYVDSAPVDPNFNPFINPHDPTHRDFNFNRNGANFAPRVQVAPQFAAAVPACA